LRARPGECESALVAEQCLALGLELGVRDEACVAKPGETKDDALGVRRERVVATSAALLAKVDHGSRCAATKPPGDAAARVVVVRESHP